MRRFDLYRSRDGLTHAVEDNAQLRAKHPEVAAYTPISTESVAETVAMHAVLRTGGTVCRVGRRIWHTEALLACVP